MRNPRAIQQASRFNSEAKEIHSDNVRAGWWSDLKTGASIVPTRNRGELMMLMVSELTEASEGYRHGLYDDKLPHRSMVEVELADTKIRILDAGGADQLDLTGAALDLASAAGVPYVTFSLDKDSVNASLMLIVNQVSRAMESHRKRMAPDALLSNRSGYEVGLACALLLIHEVGFILGLEVDEAVAEKRAFNATRSDHKIENRRAVGGKVY